MVSEDFGVFLDHVPGCYFWVGAKANAAALHASDFDFNDALLLNIPALLADLVRNTAQSHANLEPHALWPVPAPLIPDGTIRIAQCSHITF